MSSNSKPEWTSTSREQVPVACRAGTPATSVAEQQATLARMATELSDLQSAHEALLVTLPEGSVHDNVPVPADAHARFTALRQTQRGWEERMSALLDTVSALQSPAPPSARPSRAGAAGRATS